MPKFIHLNNGQTPRLRASTRYRYLVYLLVACAALPEAARAQYGNTRYGSLALGQLEKDYHDNSAFGYHALTNELTGNQNTAVGSYALGGNYYTSDNTAVGFEAAFYTYKGAQNTAVGSFALYRNDGSDNTATGFQALYSSQSTGSSSPDFNTADGAMALYSNIDGYGNTATGARALFSNRNGGVNVCDGFKALELNESGFYNVASGGFALGTNTSGSYNVATGANALYYNKGSNNTAIGHQALQNNTTGSNNIALGFQAGINLNGSNNIAIGALGAAGESNTIRIGRFGTHKATYIQGVFGASVSSTSGVPMYVDSNGHLGTLKSSARYKQEIQPMDKSSEAILQLQPVTFRYKQDLDPDGVRQFGLIAEQVEKVDPDLVVRDENGAVSTVRYEVINAMLLNEFLKEHRKVGELESIAKKQQATIEQQQTELRKTLAAQQRQLEQLAAIVQRVSDKLEPNGRASQFAANER